MMADSDHVIPELFPKTFEKSVPLFPKLLFVSFDPQTARTMGVAERAYDFLIYLSLGLCIAVSMKTTGILFVFATMVIPPMIGLVLLRRVWAVYLLAVMVAVAASAVAKLIQSGVARRDYPGLIIDDMAQLNRLAR